MRKIGFLHRCGVVGAPLQADERQSATIIIINLIIHFVQFNCHLFKSVHLLEFQFRLPFDTQNRF